MMTTKARVLSRDDILGVAKRPKEKVHIPEWGGDVWVQGLTGKERDRYEATVLERKKDGRVVPNLENARARLIAVSLVNEDGTPMFREHELDQLGELPARALQRIWDKACELSGLSESDVEELEGNSAAVQDDGSSSGSPGTSGSRSKSSQSELAPAS